MCLLFSFVDESLIDSSPTSCFAVPFGATVGLYARAFDNRHMPLFYVLQHQTHADQSLSIYSLLTMLTQKSSLISTSS